MALRFACESDDKCPRKVTIYNTNYITDEKNSTEINVLMQLVKSNYKIKFRKIAQSLKDTCKHRVGCVKKILAHDYFVEALQNFPRIKRQKGIFLFMGNLTTAQMLSDKKINTSKVCVYKVKHELSPTVGRGKKYEGYVGVLRISQNSIKQIRDELEQKEEYKIKYLMAEDICL